MENDTTYNELMRKNAERFNNKSQKEILELFLEEYKWIPSHSNKPEIKFTIKTRGSVIDNIQHYFLQLIIIINNEGICNFSSRPELTEEEAFKDQDHLCFLAIRVFMLNGIGINLQYKMNKNEKNKY